MEQRDIKFNRPSLPSPRSIPTPTVGPVIMDNIAGHQPSMKVVLNSFGLSLVKPKLFNKPEKENYKQPIATSYLGTPVWSDLEFLSGKYGNIIDGATWFDGIKLQTVLLEVAETKNIVMTSVQGRDGTVKEFISNGDKQITIRGAIVAESSQFYPRADVETLIQLVQAKASIGVRSDFLAMFNINNIVITGASFPQAEGFLNIQPFQINAVSDEPFVIKTK